MNTIRHSYLTPQRYILCISARRRNGRASNWCKEPTVRLSKSHNLEEPHKSCSTIIKYETDFQMKLGIVKIKNEKS